MLNQTIVDTKFSFMTVIILRINSLKNDFTRKYIDDGFGYLLAAN